ncbi:MAG: UvrD-helicase domain-containing protein [Chloroflexi bacterium]|nr:UvrD-helicase domain-containing protein [Chloroflexota bacterium]
MAAGTDILEKIVTVPFSLSPAQREAVLSQASYLRIVASAGAGKTETITRRIVYLITQGETAKSIVAFTFTDRAAQEMKERIYRRVEDVLGSGSCKQLGEMYIGTIHGFAMRLLQDWFGYGNYDVLDENQEVALVLRHGWSLGLSPNAKLGLTGNYSENCQLFLKSVNVVNDELINMGQLAKEAPDFASALQKYEGILDKNRLLTFSRIIRLAVEPDYLSEVVDSGQVVGFKDAIVGEAYPGLVVNLAELLRHRRHDPPGHTAVRHD